MPEKEGNRMSRRSFLKKTMGAGAAITAASVASKYLRSDRYNPYSIFAGGEKQLE